MYFIELTAFKKSCYENIIVKNLHIAKLWEMRSGVGNESTLEKF